MGLGETALRWCNRVLVPATGVQLVSSWKLDWQYASDEDLVDPAVAAPHASIQKRRPKRMNVGCGRDLKPGWLNVDARPLEPDSDSFLCCELLLINRYIEDSSVEELLAQDILEHFSWRHLDTLLQRLVVTLAPGGTLTVQSPDFDSIIDAYRSGELSHSAAQRLIYGDQTYPQNVHRNIWGLRVAEERLRAAGLTVQSVERVGYNVLARGTRT